MVFPPIAGKEAAPCFCSLLYPLGILSGDLLEKRHNHLWVTVQFLLGSLKYRVCSLSTPLTGETVVPGQEEKAGLTG